MAKLSATELLDLRICCRIVGFENMKWFVGAVHKKLDFVAQATTFDCSLGVTIDQFRYDVLRISKYQDLLVLFLL